MKRLLEAYSATRRRTLDLCARLTIEDYVVQPIEEVSPPKWHLGHTSWFFETFILEPSLQGYRTFNKNFSLLFNSYYKSVGQHWLQSDRGSLSRPTVAEVYEYRDYVDSHLSRLGDGLVGEQVEFLIRAGIEHEKQHQELLLMDIKYILGVNIDPPAYLEMALPVGRSHSLSWESFGSGVYDVGYAGDEFVYDNERPRHRFYVEDFSLANHLVTNGEYLEFVEAGGYEDPKWWLSQGWDWVQKNGISAPLYWKRVKGEWQEFTLHGRVPLDLYWPVCHVSYFEAYAFAMWKGLRLPTEQEMEVFLSAKQECTNGKYLHACFPEDPNRQLWCWTQSQYSAYPGYTAFMGGLSEYNGKFMCNQFVLRSASVATPDNHYRPTYRNFFEPQQRWMFSGIRLAKDRSCRSLI